MADIAFQLIISSPLVKKTLGKKTVKYLSENPEKLLEFVRTIDELKKPRPFLLSLALLHNKWPHPAIQDASGEELEIIKKIAGLFEHNIVVGKIDRIIENDKKPGNYRLCDSHADLQLNETDIPFRGIRFDITDTQHWCMVS